MEFTLHVVLVFQALPDRLDCRRNAKKVEESLQTSLAALQEQQKDEKCLLLLRSGIMYLISISLLPFWSMSTDNVWLYVTMITWHKLMLFLIHMSIIWLCVTSHVHTADQPTDQTFCMTKTLHSNFSTRCVHTCPACRHHWLLQCYITFTDLDLVWESQGWHKVKCIGFIFLHTFKLVIMKLNMVLKQFNWTSWYHFWVRFNEIREITAVLLTASRSNDVGMHLILV